MRKNEIVRLERYAQIVVVSKKYGTKHFDFDFDYEDLERLTTVLWGLRPLCNDYGWTFYGARKPSKYANTEYLHRTILEAPAGVFVDHLDANPQNNRRENLRVCD